MLWSKRSGIGKYLKAKRHHNTCQGGLHITQSFRVQFEIPVSGKMTIPVLIRACNFSWSLLDRTEGVSFKSTSRKFPLEPFDAKRPVYPDVG